MAIIHGRELVLYERAVDALESIARSLVLLEKYGERQVAEIDDLVAAVKQNDNVEASAVQAIQGLGTKLANAIAAQGGIPADVKAQLTALATDITNNSAALAAAITANTPSDPTTAPPSADAAKVGG